jgi:hypothetical protein
MSKLHIQRKIQMVETNREHELGSSYDLLIFIKAPDKESALLEIYKRVSYAQGKYNYYAYDCTGQWFAPAIRRRNMSWCKARKCYVARQRWTLDI